MQIQVKTIYLFIISIFDVMNHIGTLRLPYNSRKIVSCFQCEMYLRTR